MCVRACGCVQVHVVSLACTVTAACTLQPRPLTQLHIKPAPPYQGKGPSTYILTNCYESHVSLTMSCLPLSLLALSALSCAGPKCYNPPKGKTNKQLMRVALSTVCLAGDANLDRRIEALQVCDWWLCRLQQCRQMLHM